MKTTTREKLREEYACIVKSFVKNIKGLDTDGIPAPHIPIVGETYDQCAYKMAFVGMETYGWGNIKDFIEIAEKSPHDAVTKYEGWFHAGGMVEHSKNGTFWGFIIAFLAKFYQIDEKLLKSKRDDGTYHEILSSIIWGNSNAIERYHITAQKKGADLYAWKKVKEYSRAFDSINHIISAAHPKVIFLTYKNVDKNYILKDKDVHKEIPETKYVYSNKPDENIDYRYYYLREQQTHVFVVPHPTWIGAYSGIGFSKFIDSLIAAIKKYKIWSRFPLSEDDWKQQEISTSSSLYKYHLIADLASFLIDKDLRMTGEELQALFNKNNIKTSYGTKYSEEGGRGIHRVIKCVWKYFYNKGEQQIALNISRAFVGKNLHYTY